MPLLELQGLISVVSRLCSSGVLLLLLSCSHQWLLFSDQPSSIFVSAQPPFAGGRGSMMPPYYQGDYGEMEYDDGFNNGYGYGRRVGRDQAAYANYLAYYGVGMYDRNGAYSRSACIQRCLQQGRVNCDMMCRRYG